MIIIDRSTNGGMELVKLRDLLLEAQKTAVQLGRQVSNSTDEQVVELHGIPLASVANYTTTLTDLITLLESAPVESLLGNIA